MIKINIDPDKSSPSYSQKQMSADVQQKPEEADGATTEECDAAKLNKGPLRLSFHSRRRQVITTFFMA